MRRSTLRLVLTAALAYSLTGCTQGPAPAEATTKTSTGPLPGFTKVGKRTKGKMTGDARKSMAPGID